MRIIRKAEVEEIDATNDAIFTGGSVSRRRLVNEDLTEQFSFNIVSFGPGARNKLHTHTSDQVLFATEGVGYVGTEDEKEMMSTGDTAFIPAGEKHWHGATEGSSFSHVALLSPTSRTAIFE